MNANDIEAGLRFASKNNLTRREMEVLIYFLDEPRSNQEIADLLESPKTTIHHIFMRLKLKGLIDIECKDNKGTNIYKLII